MNSTCKTLFMAVAATLTLSLCMTAFAQGPADVSTATPEAAGAMPATAPAPDPVPNPMPQYPTGSSGGGDWRVGISIYGWFPGLHGTVGARGHDASVHESFS
ncbi:MAG TPA: hypothetical protein VKF63_00230, partial [Terracidiphilus sp.]|nr:hypothetical protein [Terracidiphilus sp.]